MPAEREKTLTQEIEERRRDPEFMARLCEHMAEDKAVLDRLKDSRLTSLQAGLKAEVERLRTFVDDHEFTKRVEQDGSRYLYRSPTPATTAVTALADRLENLLRESEGEAG